MPCPVPRESWSSESKRPSLLSEAVLAASFRKKFNIGGGKDRSTLGVVVGGGDQEEPHRWEKGDDHTLKLYRKHWSLGGEECWTRARSACSSSCNRKRWKLRGKVGTEERCTSCMSLLFCFSLLCFFVQVNVFE